jgi:dienelactone hydrolase
MSHLDWIIFVLVLPLVVLLWWRLQHRPLFLLPLAGVSVLLCLTQLFLEGLRWFLLPIDSISVFTFLFVSLLMFLLPRFRLPAPTGPYAVGTMTRYWVDTTRENRELMVQIWYPAQTSASAPLACYMQHAQVLGNAFGVPGFFFRHLNYLPTQALCQVALAPDQQTYPILLFSHGLGGVRTQNTFQCQELASHGYIVAAVDHTHYAAGVVFPDGRVSPFSLEKLGMTPEMMKQVNRDPAIFSAYMRAIEQALPVVAGDQRFVLDRLALLHDDDPEHLFTGRLDLHHIGAFGHSQGGATAWHLCSIDPRCKAALNLDGPALGSIQQRGSSRPIFFLGSTNKGSFPDPQIQALAQDMVTGTLDRAFAASTGEKYRMELAQSGHFNFSDAPLILPRTFGRVPTMLGGVGVRGLSVINAYTLVFFEHTLKGHPSVLLQDASPAYPEIRRLRSVGEKASQCLAL